MVNLIRGVLCKNGSFLPILWGPGKVLFEPVSLFQFGSNFLGTFLSCPSTCDKLNFDDPQNRKVSAAWDQISSSFLVAYWAPDPPCFLVPAILAWFLIVRGGKVCPLYDRPCSTLPLHMAPSPLSQKRRIGSKKVLNKKDEELNSASFLFITRFWSDSLFSRY